MHFDGHTVEIRRIDMIGLWRGLSALYTGTITGDKVEGSMSWLWEGHGQFTIGTLPWHGVIGTAPKDHAVSVETALACGSSAAITQDYEAASHWYLYAERQGNVGLFRHAVNEWSERRPSGLPQRSAAI
jgi:hypothetical protein